MSILKSIGRLVLQVALAAALVVMFFSWAPWLASRPMDQLKQVSISHGDVPPGVKSFTVTHGRIHFRELGTVSEEPVLFTLLTVAMIVDFVLLILSFPKGMRGRRKKIET